jgi:hypothetical protein
MTPRVSFLLAGVQKSGTTALAAAIARHPLIALPGAKEAHVFDAPDFSSDESVESINRRFAAAIRSEAWADPDVKVGDATPITIFHPLLVARAARYNPSLRWIVVLRDPVDRAISQWHMERARGDERWPLWAALLLEGWRLRGHEADFSEGSPLRHHSYLARGRYRRQCLSLFRHVPREQVLLLRTDDLSRNPAGTLNAVWAHLGVPAPVGSTAIPRAFEGTYRPLPRLHPARWIARFALMRDDPWSFIEQECRRGQA